MNTPAPIAEDEDDIKTKPGDYNFPSGILERRAKRAAISKDCDCFSIPTRNVLERFFSLAGFTSSNLRHGLNPCNLEEQLFLKTNQCFWIVETESIFFSFLYQISWIFVINQAPCVLWCLFIQPKMKICSYRAEFKLLAFSAVPANMLELDLLEKVCIFVVWLGRSASFAK